MNRSTGCEPVDRFRQKFYFDEIFSKMGFCGICYLKPVALKPRARVLLEMSASSLLSFLFLSNGEVLVSPLNLRGKPLNLELKRS